MVTQSILFSKKPNWNQQISDKVTGYHPVFEEFIDYDPSMIKTIIPLTIADQKYINNPDTSLYYKQNSICPSNNVIDLCNDKFRFSQFLANNGWESYTPQIGKLKYPYILKPKIGEWAENIQIITSHDDEIRFASELTSPNYFTQDFVPGQAEYTTHIIYYNGIYFYHTFEFRFTSTGHLKGRHPHTQVLEVNHQRFSVLFANILETLNYTGICCFNYKVIEGDPQIFELNPRYGASLTFKINQAINAYKEALIKRTSRRM